MIRRTLARFGIDPYLIALMTTVAVAAALPARGVGAVIANDAVSVAVALLFFLYGARLSPVAVWEGLLHWRLQSLVFANTYVLFPVLGLILTRALGGWLPSELMAGLIFVCILPSTVQSSIAFTSIARGNVAAALCSASVSNLFGMVVTPLLVVLLLDSKGGGFSARAVESIALQLLLPFVAGQLLRRWIGPFLQRHKAPISASSSPSTSSCSQPCWRSRPLPAAASVSPRRTRSPSSSAARRRAWRAASRWPTSSFPVRHSA